MKQLTYNSSLAFCLFAMQIITSYLFCQNQSLNAFLLAISMTIALAGLISALIQRKLFKTRYLHYLALFLFIDILLVIRALQLLPH